MAKNREANIKSYIIPFIIITLIFVTIMLTMRNSIKNNFYNMKREEALKISRGLSINLSRTGEGVETISSLLREKLESTLRVAKMYVGEYSNELLVELGDYFQIDEIYAYNIQGVIEYSRSGKYIGWQAYAGHPVYDFINSDQDLFIDEIRKDSESSLYYKYGYIKNTDGTIIQIGMLAEKVNALFESFMLQRILEEMGTDKNVVSINALERIGKNYYLYLDRLGKSSPNPIY